MSVTTLTSADITKIGGLISRKEDLQAKIAEIDRELRAYESGAPQAPPAPPATEREAPKSGRKPGRRRKFGSKRGQRAAQLIKALKAAAKGGVSTRKLAERSGSTVGSVNNWIYTKGKKQGVKPVGNGKCGLA